MIRTPDQWRKEYEKKDALWIHDGNPKRPHALLTSGKHSNGFFNSKLIIPDDQLMKDAAEDLLLKFIENAGEIFHVDVVVGPQTGATKLAQYISQAINARREKFPCYHASPAKQEIGGVKSMKFTASDLTHVHLRTALLCEDVVTTAGSVALAEKAIIDAGGKVLPFVLVLVNRSGLKEVDGKKILALIDHYMPVWEADECAKYSLCSNGSTAIRPKDNWNTLNAKD